MRQQRERWMELCAQVAVEQDPSRVLELVKEINALLMQKERRLGICPPELDQQRERMTDPATVQVARQHKTLSGAVQPLRARRRAAAKVSTVRRKSIGVAHPRARPATPGGTSQTKAAH
jgi:hypothetical protein